MPARVLPLTGANAPPRPRGNLSPGRSDPIGLVVRRSQMRILAIERPVEGVDDARFTPELLAAEARRAWELAQAGTIRDLYFRADQPSAVLILECEDVAAATDALAALPLVAAGLIGFEVLPLRAYPGFARLFGSTAAS
jgi:muconolactone delta-isomerase